MATDSDDLFEKLLFRVALAGRRGLGASEVEQFVKSHCEEPRAAATAPADANGADGPSTNSSINVSALDVTTLTQSFWQRLEEHADVTIKSAANSHDAHIDHAEDRSAQNNSDSVRSTDADRRVLASEERVWQAITGHGVDRKRIGRKPFELLEVVAAHGPDGVLQPEARRLTGQDKQSVPLRTAKLAEHGYIIKERVVVPKMVTSRLKLWLFAQAGQDNAGNANPKVNEYLDHDVWFDSIIRTLRNNGDIAAYSDVRAELGQGMDKPKQKALNRCAGRLEEAGLLRRLRARVQHDDRPAASERWVRCLQLLREPTDLDREAMKGKTGGAPRGSKSGRPKAHSSLSNVNDESVASEDDGERSAGEGSSARSSTTPRRRPVVHRDSTEYDGAQADLEAPGPTQADVSVALQSIKLDTNVTQMPVARAKGIKRKLMQDDDLSHSNESPRSAKKRGISTYNKVDLADDTMGPYSAQLQEFLITSGPGVYFAPPDMKKKRGPGRPRKSLVAVFKSDALRDKPWFGGEAAVVGSVFGTRPRSNRKGAQQVQDKIGVADAAIELPAPQGASPRTPAALGLSVSTLATPHETSQTPPSPREQTAKLSKHMLSQRRRRERERAEKAAANDQAARPQLTNGAAAAGGTQSVTDHSKGQQSLVVRLPRSATTLQPLSLVQQTKAQTSPSLPIQATATVMSANDAAIATKDSDVFDRSREGNLAASEEMAVQDSVAPNTTRSWSEAESRSVVHDIVRGEAVSAGNFGSTNRAGEHRAGTDAPSLPGIQIDADNQGGEGQVDEHSTVLSGSTSFTGASNISRMQQNAAQASSLRQHGAAGPGQVANMPYANAAQSTHDTAPATSPQNLSGLPSLEFVAIQDEQDANEMIDTTLWKGPKKKLDATHEERCNVLIDIIRAVNGVFPGVREIRYPFTNEWIATHSVKPDLRTVARAVDSLRAKGMLKKYEFILTYGEGKTKTFNILTGSNVDPASEQVRQVQKRMIDAWPGVYMPNEVELAQILRRQRRTSSTASMPKRGREDESIDGDCGVFKGRKPSSAHAGNDEWLDNGNGAEDEDNPHKPPNGKGAYHDNFPMVAGLTVKRTALQRATTSAAANQEDGMEDMHASHIQSRTTAASPPTSVETPGIQAVKKPRGWPKGRPRRPKPTSTQARPSAGDDVTPLLSLLFFPKQTSLPNSGTFGTSPCRHTTYTPTKASSARSYVDPSVTSRKKSAAQGNTHNPASVLLTCPRQTIHETTWTFGTDSMIESTHTISDSGRGRRVKKSTEKAALLNKPSPTAESLEKVAAFRRLHSELKLTEKAVAFSKSAPFEDPDGLVSTEYTELHADENWYHRGQGRWAQGMPPEGSSHRTAVRGPDARLWYDRVKQLGPIPRRQGPTVNGIRLNLDGTPRKMTPTHPPKKDNASAQLKSRSSAWQNVQGDSTTFAGPMAHEPPSQSTGITEREYLVQYQTPTAEPIYWHDAPMQNVFDPPQPFTVSVDGRNSRPSQTALQPQPVSEGVKRKRPYTYKSRKQLSAFDKDGVPVELDRASDDDYEHGSTPKKPRKQAQKTASTFKSLDSTARKRLSAAIALVKNLSGISSTKDLPWHLVGQALEANDDGTSAEHQYKSLSHYGPNVRFFNAMQEQMQEPFLDALEQGQLPHVDHVELTNSDWPGLLEWSERHIVPLIDDEAVKKSKKTRELNSPLAPPQPNEKPLRRTQQKRAAVSTTPVFPATYEPAVNTSAHDIDLSESLIVAKSWVRANSATRDEVYDSVKATERLTALGTPIMQAVNEMQETNTIRQLKKGRQRPGRNFEITQFVFKQFSTWPASGGGSQYLQHLADIRAKVLRHFTEEDTFEVPFGISEQEMLILNSMVTQKFLKIDVCLPPRNDDINAPGPKLNAWSYGGPRHDTRKIDRAIFDFPLVYTKTLAFSPEQGLKTGVPVPGLPTPAHGETHARVPFWIDIHGNVIPVIWEMVLSSVIYLLVRKPGITAKGIEEAHRNKLWAWETEILLQWMEKVGIAEKLGGGRTVGDAWKGGWTVGEPWYCAFVPEMATWR